MKKFTKISETPSENEILNENIREILPKMVSISNNSQITNVIARSIIEKFTPKELNDFKQWLRLIEQNTQVKTARFPRNNPRGY